MTNQTKSKQKYNSSAYTRYEFTVKKGSVLEKAIEIYMSKDKSLAKLIREMLCKYFRIDNPDELYVDQHFSGGKLKQTRNILDEINFDELEVNQIRFED